MTLSSFVKNYGTDALLPGGGVFRFANKLFYRGKLKVIKATSDYLCRKTYPRPIPWCAQRKIPGPETGKAESGSISARWGALPVPSHFWPYFFQMRLLE